MKIIYTIEKPFLTFVFLFLEKWQMKFLFMNFSNVKVFLKKKEKNMKKNMKNCNHILYKKKKYYQREEIKNVQRDHLISMMFFSK